MKYIKKISLIQESKEGSKGNTQLIQNICVSMLLINPKFLDNILSGKYSRYTHNTSVFLNDLKNLVMGNNRLKLGIYNNKKYIEDNNIGKVNNFFNKYSQDFDMVNDWTKLKKSRDIANNIRMNLIDREIDESDIKYVFWVSPNKDKRKEDIVIELNNGNQYPIINSNLNVSKTQSFNTLLDLMLDQPSDRLYTDIYLDNWDKLTKEWVRLIYDNVDDSIKNEIEEYINKDRIDSISYFRYFDITIQDSKYRHLGKYVDKLDKNYKELSKLLIDIWKNKESLILNYENVVTKWNYIKKTILNSRIIEHLIIDSLNNLITDDDKNETNGNYIISENRVKMRLMKVIVNLLNVCEIDNYYVNKNDIYHIPSRQWFRDNYSNMSIEYDYHQNLTDDDSSQFKIKLKYNNKLMLKINLKTGFSGGEMSGKLNTKMNVEYVSDWKSKINKLI